MDLGYAVDQARHYFGQNPRFHIVQASVFAPPFRGGAFDVVYSHGVLHHTYSTRVAFSHIAKLPKPVNGMLFIWLYSHEQERATPMRRTLMTIERVIRQYCHDCPVSRKQLSCCQHCLYILYQNLYGRDQLGRQFAANYGWNELSMPRGIA